MARMTTFIHPETGNDIHIEYSPKTNDHPEGYRIHIGKEFGATIFLDPDMMESLSKKITGITLATKMEDKNESN